MRCTQCGTEYTPGARYCSQCAAPLSEAPAPVAPLAAVPQGDRPAGVLINADRRLVTVLFADISGFTSLSERLDPEAVRDLITACFDRLVPCIERYGGTIDKFMGDEVMALFGAPVAHENDPERALRAALEMRDALLDFNRERGLSLGLHFGINSGLVYAGGLGGGSRQDYSVMGDVVNVAARLKGAAKPGEILVGPDSYRQTEHLLDFQATETLSLKGKAEPVPVYRLICARAAPTTTRTSRGLSSPLVGREDDLTVFKGCLTSLRAGEGGVLIVTGEAGLGKSRLVAEVRSRAQNEGLSWLEGRTLSFGRTISYWPLLEIIQKDAGIDSDDSEAERWAKLSTRIAGLFREDASDILPYLATLLSLPIPEDLVQKVRFLDGEAMGRQIYRATRLYFARLAAERPTVVVFEDLHWLDGSSAALLEHLLPLANEAPILFCLVSRPEADSALTRLQELARESYAERLTEIALGPLTPEESTLLVRNLAHLDELPARLRDTIIERAEGNPFFVEEVVRSLIELGGLEQDPATGRYRVTEKATHLTIPDTLQGLIMARIDRLDDDLKAVLRLASVIGRSFFYRVLAGIAEADRDLDQNLSALQTRELIREKARDPELEYIFKHALVQEATYESILLQRRREIHRKVAASVELFFAERLDEFYSLLAYHYSKAEDWEKAQEYLFKAGDQAGSIAADAEALAHYEEAVEAYTRAFGDEWDPLQRAALERKMGEALYRRGDHEQAREYLYRALASLGSPHPATPAALRRALVRQLLVQISHRFFWWLPRRPLSPEAVRVMEERFWIGQFLGMMEVGGDPVPLLFDCFETLNACERARLDWPADAYYGLVSWIFGFVPLRRISSYYYRRCFRRVGQKPRDASRLEQWSAAFCSFAAGMHEYLSGGGWMEARGHVLSARPAFFAIGDARFWSATADQLSNLLIEQGEFEEALAFCEESIRFGHETGDPVAEAWGQMDAGDVLYAQGALEEAEANLRPAAAQLLASLDPANAAKSAARIAHCYLRQGRLEEARAILADESARVRAAGSRGYFIRNVRTGNAALALVALEQAGSAEKSRALKDAQKACRELLKHGKGDIAALVPANRLQGTYEWLRDSPHKAEKWWRKSLDLADMLGARYEGALTRLEMGWRLGDRAELELAEAEFAEMGAAFDLAEARRLLGRSETAEQAVGP